MPNIGHNFILGERRTTPKQDRIICAPVGNIHQCSPYLNLGLVLLVLKVFDHVREPNRQTIVTLKKGKSREDGIKRRCIKQPECNFHPNTKSKLLDHISDKPLFPLLFKYCFVFLWPVSLTSPLSTSNAWSVMPGLTPCCQLSHSSLSPRFLSLCCSLSAWISSSQSIILMEAVVLPNS